MAVQFSPRSIPTDVGSEQRVAQLASTNFPATGTFGDLGSISLTPGTWDVSFVMYVIRNGATATNYECGISTTTGNSTTGLNYGDNRVGEANGTPNFLSLCIAQYRVVVSSTTTYYAKVSADFSAGTPQYRGRMSAVRVL